MKTQLYIIGLMCFCFQLVNSQNRILKGRNELRLLGEEFVMARNETDTIARLLKLNKIMGGSDIPKYATNKFLGGFLKSGGKFTPKIFYAVGGGKALHIVGQERKTGEWMRYQLGLDLTKKQLKIGLIAQTPSREPVKIPEGNITDKNVLNFLSQDLSLLSTSYGFSGSLLISKKGKILIEKYFGYASDDNKYPIDRNTAISMASGSKMFTAVLIGCAIQEGLLDFEMDLGTILTDFSNKRWAQNIKIKHLLSHSSGLPEYWDDEFDKYRGRITSLKDIVPFFINKPIEFQAGTESSYINTNFIVLGLILESIYKKKYSELLQEKIFSAFKMNHTLINADPNVNYYFNLAPQVWEVIPSNTTSKMGSSSAGGVSSTPRDLLKFTNALRDNLLLTSELKSQMTTPKTKLGSGEYGYGFEVTTINNQLRFGHGGRGPGVHFMYKYHPEKDLLVTFVTNRDSTMFLDFMMNLEFILSRE